MDISICPFGGWEDWRLNAMAQIWTSLGGNQLVVTGPLFLPWSRLVEISIVLVFHRSLRSFWFSHQYYTEQASVHAGLNLVCPKWNLCGLQFWCLWLKPRMLYLFIDSRDFESFADKKSGCRRDAWIYVLNATSIQFAGHSLVDVRAVLSFFLGGAGRTKIAWRKATGSEEGHETW